MKQLSLTLLAAASLGAQTYINGGRTVQGAINYCSDQGANDAYSCSLSPAITSYVAGASYYFRANTANTGTATLELNGLGARAIKKQSNADLADNDIKAGQLVLVMFDGANMQMMSQTGTATSGGGGGQAPVVITTAPRGHWAPFGEEGGTWFVPNITDRDLRLWQVTLPFRATIGRITLNVKDASGSACPGGVCGLVAAIYDAACASLVAWGRAVSGGSPDIATPGAKSIVLDAAVTLDAGPYYLGVMTDSSALSLFAKDASPFFVQTMNLNTVRYGSASNRGTGNGAALAPPTACGSLTALGAAPPAINIWER